MWHAVAVATRKYEQRLRAESAEETRRRILDAVTELVREAPTEPISLERVAAAAGVARSTIYGTFGSRAGLLQAFAEDLWARTGIAHLTEAVAHPDAREHLRAGIAAASRMFDAERDTYRSLFSMARLDPSSTAGAVERMVAERAGGMEHLARRLADAKVLRKDTTVEDAAHLLWVITSFESFDALATVRGLPLAKVVDLLTEMAERTLCR